jgi:anti-anti-sigma factor
MSATLIEEPGRMRLEGGRNYAHAERVQIVTLEGDQDLASYEELVVTLDQAIAKRPERLVVDLTRAPFISVGCLYAIATCADFVDRLVIRGSTGVTKRVLAATGLEALVEVEAA